MDFEPLSGGCFLQRWFVICFFILAAKHSGLRFLELRKSSGYRKRILAGSVLRFFGRMRLVNRSTETWATGLAEGG